MEVGSHICRHQDKLKHKGTSPARWQVSWICQVHSLWHSTGNHWKQRSPSGAETQQCMFRDQQGELWSFRGLNLSGKDRERAGLSIANFSWRLNYKKAWEQLFIKCLKNYVPRLGALLNWVATKLVLLINFSVWKVTKFCTLHPLKTFCFVLTYNILSYLQF